MLPLLDSRDLDVVFIGAAPDPSSTAYVVRSILETPAVFVASPSHPLANERRIPIQRLAAFKGCGLPITRIEQRAADGGSR